MAIIVANANIPIITIIAVMDFSRMKVILPVQGFLVPITCSLFTDYCCHVQCIDAYQNTQDKVWLSLYNCPSLSENFQKDYFN